MRVAEPEADLADITARLAGVVREAGAVALTKFRVPLKSWMKGNASPVCEADIAVDELLRQRLAVPDPSYGWLSEESVDDFSRLQARRVWIVDPIDGTRAFIAGRDDWCIAAALVEDGRPIVGALYAPVDDALFLASRNGGATLNGEPMHPRDAPDLDGAVAAGPPRRLEMLVAAYPQIKPAPKVHSLALRLARVAVGTLDVAIAGANSHDWDIAAADLIVHEAGGLLTGLDERPPIYNRADPRHGVLIAAGRQRHATLIGLVRAGHVALH